jgi:hypothetical protein
MNKNTDKIISLQSQNNIKLDDADDDLDNDYENYVINTKMNNKLLKELGLTENNYDEKNSYEPPKEHGLSNSNVIIPAYYHIDRHPSKILNIDYYEIIKDDIRNFRTLNSYQLEYIKKLSHEQKNELFDLFNSCMDTINKLL